MSSSINELVASGFLNAGFIFGEIIKIPQSFNELADGLKVTIREKCEEGKEITLLFPSSISKSLSFARLQDLVAVKAPIAISQRSPAVLEISKDKIPEFEFHTAVSGYQEVISYFPSTIKEKQDSFALKDDKIVLEKKQVESCKLKFTPISDLIPGTVSNVYAVISSLKPPKKTKGTDYVATLTLIDPSVENTDKTLSVIIFRHSANSFPVIFEGDVVRCCKLKIQKFENLLQGLADRETTIISFEGKISNSVAPRGPLISGTIDESDVSIVQSLKQWNANVDKSQKKFNVRRKFLKTKEIAENVFFDYVGQVVKILDPIGANPCDVILTDFTRNPKINTDPSYYNVPSWYPSDVLLITSFWDVNAAIAANLKESQYICLRNLRGKIVQKTGQLVAVMHSMADQKENIISLFSSDDRVVEIKRQKSVILQENEGFYPELTLTLQPSIEACKISSILFATKAAKKYKIKAQLIGYFPKDFREFSRYFCNSCSASMETSSEPLRSCPLCGKFYNLSSFIFMFCLIFQDETGELPVIVFGEDANIFLDGIIPINYYVDAASCEVLKAKILKLFTENSPFIDCCIKSYQIVDKMGKSERRFRLFDTILK